MSTASSTPNPKNWDMKQIQSDVDKLYDALGQITPNQTITKNVVDSLYSRIDTFCQHLGFDVSQFAGKRRNVA